MNMINRKSLLLIIFGIIVIGIFSFMLLQFLSKKEVQPPAITRPTFSSHTDDTLRISFQYPNSWGEIQTNENIESNYLFPNYPPDGLITEFKRRGMDNEFIAIFKEWDSEKQLDYLIKDRIGYDKFLNKTFIISFSKNEHLKIYAFNKNYVDFSGYECSVPISPIYRGNLLLNDNVCFSPDLFSQIKIENFYTSDCRFLLNGLVLIPGTFEEDCVLGEEMAYLVVVGNLKQNKEYAGLLIEHSYKSYENPGVELMNFFGYSGYGTGEKEIREVNIAACNTIQGGSAPSTETFYKYFNKIIDDTLIQNFISFVISKLNTISIDQKVKTLIVRKYQDELAKNKSKKFIDYRDGKNFHLYFNVTEDLIEKINNTGDIERYFPQINPNDINCAVYKIHKKQNLDTFRRDIENNQQLLEFQSFIESVVIK